jgi:hypothetical protein
VRTDPAMIARAQLLLERYQDLWRHRIRRIDALLAQTPAAPESKTETPGGSHARD